MLIDVNYHSKLRYPFRFSLPGVIVNEFQKVAAVISELSEPLVLATLVEVIGSSYRQPGARMVFDQASTYAGVISAGCLETDIIAHAKAALVTSDPMLAAYDMGSDLDLIWGTGMGCQGKVKVLLAKMDSTNIPYWVQLRSQMLEQRQFGAMALVYAINGQSTDLKVGDWFLYNETSNELFANGAFASWKEALKTLMMEAKRTGIASSVALIVNDIKYDFLIEPILPPFALWLFGASEHARPIASLAKNLGWFTGIVDHRPALATPECFPNVDKIVLGPLEKCVDDLPLDNRTATLIVSHIYEKDKQAIQLLANKPVAYIGLQGNRKRSQRLFKELVATGFVISEDQNNKIYYPAGLDIGAETPEANALSMLAEIQAVFMGHDGSFLRAKSGLIH